MSVRANIIIDQGSTFTAQLQLNTEAGDPIDVSTYTINSQIRKNYASINSFSFSTGGSTSGIITLNMNANTSRSIAAGRYVYDVVLTNPYGTKIRIMEGQVTVAAGVTR